jgi:hypothetical protein
MLVKNSARFQQWSEIFAKSAADTEIHLFSVSATFFGADTVNVP